MKSVEQLLKETRAFMCLDCGKCTGACPLARQGGTYSPRLHIARMVYGYESEVLADMDMWSCLTCGLCETKCPSAVEYTDFISEVRMMSAGERRGGFCAHAGITHTLARMMANDGGSQNRLAWVGDELNTVKKGDVLFFVGCLPYFDTIFEHIKIEGTRIASSVVELLNKLGVVPVLMKNEVCCGHDLLWSGDRANFEKLVKKNAEAIAETGARTIVTSCAECLRTLKLDYPKFAKFDYEVKHISEFVAERLGGSSLAMKQMEGTITYQDPCRLGRHLKVYEPPREVLASIPGAKLVEMRSNKDNATCCGTTHFLNCDRVSEEIRKERFAEALATGAKTLVTACPKCQIHLKCSQSNRMQDEGVGSLEITDFATIVNKHLVRN
jgi:heterodisulfide reductase subunit D